MEAAIRLAAAVLAMTILAGCGPQSGAEQAGPDQVLAEISHPLDPLTEDEYVQTVALLRAAGHVNDSSRFSSLDLLDPEKTIVQAWQPGDEFGRAAFAVVPRCHCFFDVHIRHHGISQGCRQSGGCPGSPIHHYVYKSSVERR